MNSNSTKNETAILAGGCFWCLEAVFRRVEGVERVRSGYTAGHTKNPTYDEVCSGTTGHAEAVEIIFNPKKVSYLKLLEVFFTIHDPTTLNRQGSDTGTQYRSGIYTLSAEQKKQALDTAAKLNKAGIWKNPIVTEIIDASVFTPAEIEHEAYYERNKNKNPYCGYVITPKVEKFRKVFSDIERKTPL